VNKNEKTHPLQFKSVICFMASAECHVAH